MFFSEAPTAAVEVEQRREKIAERRETFWDVHEEEFLRIIELTPEEFVSYQQGYPYDELLALAAAQSAE